MATTLKHILELLDQMAPFSLAEEWDNAGLQVGHPSWEVSKIFVALDPTPDSVDRAAAAGAQLLLTHHPLIFSPLTQVNPESYPGSVVREALTRKISIISLHTNLDAARGGINDILADLIGLNDVEVLEKNAGAVNDGAGMGRIGNLPGVQPLSEFCGKVKEALHASEIRIMGDKEMTVRRVAVVGGAGGGMSSLASKNGADLFITGDIRHHEALLAGTLGLALIDGGHFQTEKAALNVFAEQLQDRFMEKGLNLLVENFQNEKKPLRIG